MQPSVLKKHLSPIVLLLVVLASANANAGGFSVARFGGANGTAVDANPTALYYNPAAPAFSAKGTQLYVDLTMVARSASYYRAANQVSPYSELKDPFASGGPLEHLQSEAKKANVGLSTLNNFLVLPMAGITTDFGLGVPFRFGVAFFIPFGGSAVWNRSPYEKEINESFKGGGDGTVRWFSMDGTVQTLAVATGLAYQYRPWRLSFGATFNTYITKVETLRARNADNSDHLVNDKGEHFEGRSFLSAKSVDFGMGLGMMAEPIEDRLWVGFSWQSRPNLTGKMYLHGKLSNVFGIAKPSEPNDIQMTWTLPDIIRFGVKGKVSDTIELKLNFDYTRWSTFKKQCVVAKKDGKEIDDATMERLCATYVDGGRINDPGKDDPSVLQYLQRNWKDTFSVRFDAAWQALDWLRPNAGISYDSNAIPDETLDPALMDMNKISLSVGSDFIPFEWLQLGVSLSNVFYITRDTTETAYYRKFKGNSKQPGNGGIYKQNNVLINTTVMFSF